MCVKDANDKTIEYTGEVMALAMASLASSSMERRFRPATLLARGLYGGRSHRDRINVYHAGDYVLETTYSGKTYKVEFTVNPIDLSTAKIAFGNGAELYTKTREHSSPIT